MNKNTFFLIFIFLTPSQASLEILQQKLQAAEGLRSNIGLIRVGSCLFSTAALGFVTHSLYHYDTEQPDFREMVKSCFLANMFYVGGGALYRIHKYLDDPVVEKIAQLKTTIEKMRAAKEELTKDKKRKKLPFKRCCTEP